MKNVLMTKNLKISEPIVNYLHSGESEFNYFISYKQNKNVEYDLIFGKNKKKNYNLYCNLQIIYYQKCIFKSFN